MYPPLFVPFILVAITEHGAERTSDCSWTREEEEVIHKVCGPSRGSRQIEASIYKLSLSPLVHSLFYQ